MKKRLLALVMVAAMALSVTACGKKDSSEDSAKKEDKKEQTSIEYDVDEYVTLGDYKGIEVTLEGEYEYSKEGFQKYVDSTLTSTPLYVKDDSQTEIKEDSIVNVDYVGSKDDVPFDGGSAENQTIDVANNCAAGGGTGYIEGFTAGLVGHEVGEEVAYEVTFPKEYGNADLAGQTVTFTFLVNYIAKPIESEKDLTDKIVSDKFGVDTVDEYMDSLKEKYNQQLESNLKSDTETAVMNSLVNNCKVSEVPADLLQARVDMILKMQDKQYQAYGTTFKDYVTSMGYDYDEQVAQLTESIKDNTETELILEAIAKAEDIQIDEKDYSKFITNIYTQMGYSDEESFYKDFTVDGYDGERYFRLAYLTEKATDFCVENAVVNATSTIAD